MAFWNLLFGRHAGIFSLNGMLTVFPDSDRVPNPQPSCAFPPQKIRFLAGKPLLVPTPTDCRTGAKEPVTSQARGWGHFATMTTIQNKAARLVNRIQKRAERNVVKIIFGEKTRVKSVARL